MLIPFPFEDAVIHSGSSADDGLEQAVYGCFVDAGVYVDGQVYEWPHVKDVSVSEDATLTFKICANWSDVSISVGADSSVPFPVLRGSAPWGSYVVSVSSDGISEFRDLVYSRSSSSGGSSPSSHYGSSSGSSAEPPQSSSSPEESSPVASSSSYDESSSGSHEHSSSHWESSYYSSYATSSSSSYSGDESPEEASPEESSSSYYGPSGSSQSSGYGQESSSSNNLEYRHISTVPTRARAFCNSSVPGEGGAVFRICPRCVTCNPVSVSSILVYDGVHEIEDGPHFVLSGDVSVKPGNNMSLAAGEDPGSVELNANPGDGLGPVPCSCKDGGSAGPFLSSADGHVRLFNDTCYDLEPDTSTGVIRIHSKCTACCTCQMYGDIVNERLAPLADAVRNAHAEIQSMHQSYESAVAAFNDRISRPSISDVTLTLSGMPIGSRISPNISNRDVNGKMERCVFTATVTNNSYFDVTVSISSMYGSDSIVESSAAWSDASGGPKSRTTDGPISGSYVVYPGRSLVVTFVSVHNRMVSYVETGGYTGRFSANVSWSGGNLGALSKSVNV